MFFNYTFAPANQKLKVMKRIRKFSIIAALTLMSGLMFSCKDDAPLHEKEYSEKHSTYDNIISSEYDEVKSFYDGSVAMLNVNSEDLAPYFQKRMGNVTSTITSETDVVMLSEQGAMIALSNANVFKSLQEHWNNNKPVGFVYPSENVLKLIAKLQGAEIEHANANDAKSIRQYAVYMLRADGNAVSYINPRFAEVHTQYIDSNGVEHETNKLLTQNIEVSEATKGRMAERTVEWLNNKPAFKGGYGDISYEPFTHKTYKSVTVDHKSLVEKNGYGKGCANQTTEVAFEITVNAGFDLATKRDIYDVVVSEVFDASRSYLEDKIVKSWGPYDTKYTGGNYAGMDMEMILDGVPNNLISFTDAAPISCAGSYSVTHTPPSLQVSAGNSGKALALSAAYTPPSTSISMTYDELPVNYKDFHSSVEWDYGMKLKDYPEAYGYGILPWVVNKQFLGVFGFSKNACKTQQAATYRVDCKGSFEKHNLSLRLTSTFKTYHEVASATSQMREYSYTTTSLYVALPRVNRYFDKYSPYCYALKVNDSTEKWEDLENTLKSNVNYKIFHNENIQIGTPEEGGLENAATGVWEDAMNSIITQFGKSRHFNNEYVVALANSKGEALKKGLYVHDGTWEIVENIELVHL